MDDEAKQDAVGKVLKQARAEARAELFGGGGSAPAKADDPWSAFPDRTARKADKATAGGRVDASPDPPQRDVLGNLRQAIPGVSFTSGFRTREYQANMHRRGYRPADNSGHLDGSSLDLTPPLGKSMRSLMDRVKQAEPDAVLLPEGDHLHAAFPGWYGAPVLGGARAADLVNPMAVR